MDKALEFYKKAIQIHPSYAHAHCNMGVIHKEQGDLDRAVQCYKQALTVSTTAQLFNNP